MLIKNRDIVPDRFIEAFNFLIEAEDISFTQAMEISQSIDLVNKAIEITRKKHHALVVKFGTPYFKDSDVENPVVAGYEVKQSDEENHAHFQIENEKLLNEEFELPLKDKVVLNVLPKGMKPAHLYLLKNIIEVKVK